MSGLQSAIDELTSVAPESLSDDELDAEIVELRRARVRLEARQVELVAAADGRRLFEDLGFVSAASWLADRLRAPHGVGVGMVGVARALRQMPEVAAAFGAGSIDLRQVRMLVAACRLSPGAFAEAETSLVDAAETLPPHRFRAVVEYWKAAADPGGWESEQETLLERRSLHASVYWDRMVRIDGDLDPEGGQVVLTALQSAVDTAALDPADRRSPAQARADALVEICRQHLDQADLPTSGGERPHLDVVVDLDALQGRGGRAELPDTGPITPEAARRLACDSSVCRVITRGRSAVLDVGRRTRVVPAALRRALVVRDRGCRAPGCDRPPRWCDAHHLIAWVDGGRTDLANLILLCRRHHRMVHEGTLILPQPGRDP